MLVGAVLLWRALCGAAIADSADLLDPRFVGEWESPGLTRSVKLTFKDHECDTTVPLARYAGY
jgi:hypothetical protein